MKGDSPQNNNLPCKTQLIKIISFTNSCTNRRMLMRVLLYMGFTTPPNVFNELKKENTFWYTDQHNKDGKTLTEMPHIRQLLSESRLIDLSDISRKLTKLGRCLFLGGFVQRRQTDGK